MNRLLLLLALFSTVAAGTQMHLFFVTTEPHYMVRGIFNLALAEALYFGWWWDEADQAMEE